MFIRTVWLSILPFQHFSDLAACAASLSLHLSHTTLQKWILYPHNFQSISHYLCCSQCSFLVLSQLWTCFDIASCAGLLRHRQFLPPSRTCLHLYNDMVIWISLLNCHIGPPRVAKGSISEGWPWYFVLPLFLSGIFDVARYGQYADNLHLWCHGWYIRSTSKKQNLRSICNSITNSDANYTT